MAETAETTQETTEAAASATTETAQAASAAAETATAKADAAAEDIASLPDWAQKLVKDTRKEAATYRTKAGNANEALDQTKLAIAKALGLQKDDDPVVAARTASEERDAARAQAKSVKIENAVLKAAVKAGADPESLTDSRSFMAKLSDIDPDADDFGAQVGAAIKAAVDANPALKVGGVTVTRSGGAVSGASPAVGQLSREDLKAMTPDEIVKAKENGQLNALLGVSH